MSIRPGLILAFVANSCEKLEQMRNGFGRQNWRWVKLGEVKGLAGAYSKQSHVKANIGMKWHNN